MSFPFLSSTLADIAEYFDAIDSSKLRRFWGENIYRIARLKCQKYVVFQKFKGLYQRNVIDRQAPNPAFGMNSGRGEDLYHLTNCRLNDFGYDLKIFNRN